MSSIRSDVDGAFLVENLNPLRCLLAERSHGVVHLVFAHLERLSSGFGGPGLQVELAFDEPLQQFCFKLRQLVGHGLVRGPALKIAPMSASTQGDHSATTFLGVDVAVE